MPQQKQVQLDQKDLRIVEALDKFGAKASMKRMSEVLGLPPRTLRYRLKKLRDNNYLEPVQITTHERRIGLGENMLLLEMGAKRESFPIAVLDALPPIYWFSSTYGRFIGYAAHSVYSLSAPDANLDLVKSMQANGLISDYYVFDIIDYQVGEWDISWFRPDEGWTWDWEDWALGIEEVLQADIEVAASLVEMPEPVTYDFKDVMAVRILQQNAQSTLKEMASQLGLSISQIRRRVRRLEELGVIRGYKSVFTPFHDLLTVMNIVESGSELQRILLAHEQLPFPFDVLWESSHKACFRLRLSASDLAGYLKGFDRLRHLVDYQLFQVVHDERRLDTERVFSLFDRNQNCWKTHDVSYFDTIRNFARRADE